MVRGAGLAPSRRGCGKPLDPNPGRANRVGTSAGRLVPAARMGVPVKVDLRLTDDGRRLFQFHRERAEADHDHPPTHPGLRGWFERKVHQFKDLWQHSHSGLVLWTRGVWDW